MHVKHRSCDKLEQYISAATAVSLTGSNSYNFRGQGDFKLSPLPNLGLGSGRTTTNTSPLHPRLSGLNLESPGRVEDGKSECHRLPLPPGSPTSPSALPTPRTCLTTEGSNSNLSKWKKGKLLGRGTFGHVYVGFNR